MTRVSQSENFRLTSLGAGARTLFALWCDDRVPQERLFLDYTAVGESSVQTLPGRTVLMSLK